MTKKSLWSAMAAIAISGVAACGGAGTGTTSPPAAAGAATAGATAPGTGPAEAPAGNAAANACKLLSAADVTAAYGQPITDTTTAGTSGTLCTFDSPDHVKGLALSIYANRNAMALFLQSSGEAIPGLGDDAYWLPNGTVFVRKGDRGFSLLSTGLISLTDPSANDAAKTTMVGLAKLAEAKF